MEKWLPIKGYEGLYEVSDLGRIRSLTRMVNLDRWGGKMRRNGKVLSLKRTRGNPGYCIAQLYDKKGRGKGKSIHRAVAIAFIPNLESKPQVNHKDGNPKNNQAANLEWCTGSENIRHSFLLGHRTPAKGEQHGMSVLTQKDVDAIRLLYANLKFSRRRMSELFSVSIATIDKIIKNKGWRI